MTVYFWNCDWIARFILSIHNPTKKASLESNALCIEVRYAISYTVRSCNAISKSFPYIACKQLFNSIKDVLDTRLGVNEAWVEEMLLEIWNLRLWCLNARIRREWLMYHQRRQPAPELLEAFERRFWIDAIGIGCITVRAFLHLPELLLLLTK